MNQPSTSRFVIARHAAYRLVQDEVVIVDALTSQMLTLNPTASVIWQKIADGMELADVARQLADEFEVSLDEAHADVAEFVRNMKARGLMQDVP